MVDSTECHVTLLPNNEKEIIKLIRHGNTVHKFTIKNGTAIQRLTKEYGEIAVQQKLQSIMLYVINMDEQESVEVQLSTSLLTAKIGIYPWQLSTKIFFKSHVNEVEYKAGKVQFVLSVNDKISVDSEKFDSTGFSSTNLDSQQANKVMDSKYKGSIYGISDLYANDHECNSTLKNVCDEENRKPYRINTASEANAEMQKGYIIDNRSTNEEEIRLVKFLNAKGLDSSKLLSKCAKKPQGFFTRLFRFLKLF